MLEWYDFTVYALFAGYIAQNFFPDDGPDARLIKTFLFFGLGFIVRPLGAVLIGNYADRAGRKAALTLTILLMATGTGVIAFSPTYASIGIGAPILLLLGRVLQGFSAGGEIGSATAYLLESGDPRQRGRFASWLEASMGMANILGALAAFSVASLLSESEIRSWGWRLPFIFGLGIAPVGLYLRRSLDETEEFRSELELRGKETVRRAPLLEIFSHHGRTLLFGFCVAVLWAVAVYVLMVFMPTYVQRPDTFNFSARQAFGASLLGNIPFVFGCFWFGVLSDRVGRRVSLFASASALLILTLPLFMWLRAAPTLLDAADGSIHGVHSGRQLRRCGAGGLVGNFPDRRALDRHIPGLQWRVHRIRRICTHDSDLGQAAIEWFCFRARMVCDVRGGPGSDCHSEAEGSGSGAIGNHPADRRAGCDHQREIQPIGRDDAAFVDPIDIKHWCGGRRRTAGIGAR